MLIITSSVIIADRPAEIRFPLLVEARRCYALGFIDSFDDSVVVS